VAGFMKGTSDPYAVIKSIPNDHLNEKPRVLGKTEVVKNDLNPDWTKTLTINYTPDVPFCVQVKILDKVNDSDDKEMGYATFDIDKVLKVKGNTIIKALKQGGNVFLRAEKAVGKGYLRVKLSGSNLINTEGFLRKPDPFYQFSKQDIGHR